MCETVESPAEESAGGHSEVSVPHRVYNGVDGGVEDTWVQN